MDLGTTIEPKSNQLNADDLIMGPMTVQITKVTGGETKEQPVKISFAGDNGKPYLPCKTARRLLVMVWGRDGVSYVGRSVTLYRDPDVKFGGIAVGGIRISHMSHIDKEITVVLTASKTSRKPFTVRPLTTAPNTPTDPDVKAAGDEAAKGGVDSYKTWLASLDPEVKKTVAWLHKEWSRVAKAVVVPDPDDIAFDDGNVDESERATMGELRAVITEIATKLKDAGDSIDFTDTAKLDEWCEQEFDAKYLALNEPQLQTLRDELQDRLDAY